MMTASEVATQTCMRTSVAHAGDTEQLVKDGHDDAPAADAEQAGEKPHEQAARRKGRGKRRDFAQRQAQDHEASVGVRRECRQTLPARFGVCNRRLQL